MRTAELWDGRLSKAYTGPEDPRFREDTLVSIMERQKAEAAFGFAWARPGFRDDAWYQLCEAFLIHRDSTSREAAAAVLQRGRPRARELAVLAEVLGRDRESRRQTGTSPEEAVSQAFEEEWRKLERLKAEAREEGSVMALVALGDTDLLAQVLAGGAPLYPPGYRSPEGRRGGSQDGSEDGSGSWTTLSRSDSAASGGLAEGQEGRAASEGGEQAPAPAGSEAGEPTAGRGAGRRGARRGARREREGEGDASVEDGDEDGVSFLDELEEARDRDRTALHMAAFLSMPACIEVLVKAAEARGEKQAYLDAGDYEGVTALMRAVRSGTGETVKALLAAGASPNKKDRDGRVALHRAVAGAAAERELWRLQVLLAAPDLDINALDEDGLSALHIAIEHNELECMQALLAAGADANQKDRVGCTPLHIACLGDDVEAVEILLASGADASVRNEDGQTAGDLAEEQGNEELADMLHRRTALKRLQTFTSSSRGRAGGAGGDAEEAPEGQACCICLTRPKTVILAPCGHRCACKRCMRGVMEGRRERRKCPVCQELIESFITKVYD